MLVCCILTISCSGDEDEPVVNTTPRLNKTSISLYPGNTEKLIYSGGNSCTWASKQPLIASVSSGLVTAHKVGSTTITANNLVCSVKVLPKYTMYTEPSINWGSSKTSIKSKMSNYDLYKETTTQLAYKSDGMAFAYIYTFENDKLTGSSMGIYLSKATSLVDFIGERYIFVEEDDETLYFMSIDNKTAGGIYFSSSYATVIYLPVSESKSRGFNYKDEVNELFEQMQID